MCLVGHTQIHDGQHHEDESLQGNNHDMKNRPAQTKNELGEECSDSAGVGEVSQRFADGLGTLL